MFNVGELIPSEGLKGIEYSIVVEAGNRLLLELVDDYIMRCYTVPYESDYCTLREIVECEKQRIISKGYINV